jgi:hypothetical protein
MLAYSTLKNNGTNEWKPAWDPGAETTVALFGTGQYKLTVMNNGNTWIGEVRLLDILPHVGDVQVLSPYRARGSEWRAALQSVRLQMFDADHHPASGQEEPQIRYSAQSDPDYNFNGDARRSDRPDGDFAGDAAITEARSFDLAMPGRIPPGYSVEILVTVKAPPEGVTGQVAYNSFVATANFYETSSSPKVKTTTTFEPSKQKFILYATGGGASPGDGNGGVVGDGGNGGGGNGAGGGEEAGKVLGGGGSQTAGGAMRLTLSGTNPAHTASGFGVGSSVHLNTIAGGGGGWYGGGNGNGAGGGSGYVLTSTSYKPSGYFAEYASYYLDDPINVQITDSSYVEKPTSGNGGYAQITFVSP